MTETTPKTLDGIVRYMREAEYSESLVDDLEECLFVWSADRDKAEALERTVRKLTGLSEHACLIGTAELNDTNRAYEWKLGK